MKFLDPDKSEYLALFYGADGAVVDTGLMTLQEAFQAARASGCSLAILHRDCLWDAHEKIGRILRDQSPAAVAQRSLDALEAANGMIEMMAAAAHIVKLEGTREWDEVAGAADMYGVQDKIRSAIAKATA